MEHEAICGKRFELDKEDPTVEDICLKCGKENCMTYVQYVYAVTHYNNPRS